MEITTNANDMFYQLRIRGAVDQEFLSSYCPPGTGACQEGNTTLLTDLHMDQSGILGLVRQLHNLGLVILELKVMTP